MQIQISDEGTRTALESVLWHALADHLGERSYYDAFTACGYDVAEDKSTDATDEADAIIEAVTAIRREIDAVRKASLGEQVEIVLDVESVQRGLGSVRYAVEEGCSFWDKPAESRARMTATRDAAVRLQADFPVAEAVA